MTNSLEGHRIAAIRRAQLAPGQASNGAAPRSVPWLPSREQRLMVRRGRVPDPLLLRTRPSTAERARRLRKLVPHQSQRMPGDDRPAPPPVAVPTAVGPPRLRFPGIRW